jgi:hypothetical protein
MKKLILIFTLLISSFNVSAYLLKDNDFLRTMRLDVQSREELAQNSFDTYKTFLEFNAQQDRDNPTGSRVSEDLMNDAKTLAMFDLIQYAIIETFEAAIARDETITIRGYISPEDEEVGNKAAQEIIGPWENNPVFSVEDQVRMRKAVARYVSDYQFNRDNLNGPAYALSILTSLGGYDLATRFLYHNDPRTNIREANRFSRNFLSTFFTNQNAVQSTCLGMSCAAPVGGM